MSNFKTLQHTEWDCKYHEIFIPKYRRTTLYGTIRQHLGEIFRRLARQKECEIERRSFGFRPCSYDDLDSVEALRFPGRWIHQREKCGSHRSVVQRTTAKLHRAALLGSRVLCVDRVAG